ncbi:hypothetical protein GVN20_04160 [Runella sp. CRIBMP]|uniref:sensor histidine kinase n=1 Tax=Runella sp. CRIBMP TaxID=2683261 RepID=UPI0014127274|nr:histidine kinase [Runella sp. CRIBMP]NBB18542.1 hypothetical protein [Runella sp. CRIBMP]
MPKLLDKRMNRLDQRNSRAFEVIEKVLHFYNERLWLRVLVHLGYLYFCYKNLLAEFYVDNLRYSTSFYLYLGSNILAGYFIFYYLFPKYFAREKYLAFFSAVAFWYFTVFTYCTFLFVQEIYGLNKVNAYSTSREDNPLLAFVDTFNVYGLWGHFTSLPFAFTVFYEFRNQFGLIVLAKTMKYFMENTIKQKQLNDLNHDLESKFLQSQLNPHFLFNSLNNIYGLILSQKPETQTAISQLQSLLKQSFDDSLGSKVPLQSEVDYLKNYVNLEKIRHDKNVTIEFDTDEAALQNRAIAPRVLLPFVENAFKHSLLNNLDHAHISICLILKDRQLDFRVKNTKPVLKITKTNVGGIGLVNIRRRLSLLYPNHLLTIQENTHEYEVNLKLYL